jgi:hypothetical protein
MLAWISPPASAVPSAASSFFDPTVQALSVAGPLFAAAANHITSMPWK